MFLHIGIFCRQPAAKVDLSGIIHHEELFVEFREAQRTHAGARTVPLCFQINGCLVVKATVTYSKPRETVQPWSGWKEYGFMDHKSFSGVWWYLNSLSVSAVINPNPNHPVFQPNCFLS